MYHPKDIIHLIGDNVRKTGNPFGIPKFIINQWWKGVNIPKGHNAMLFTGLMYQFVPYIEKSTSYLSRFEDSRWAQHIRFGKYIPKWMAGLGLAAITPKAERKKFNCILQNIVRLMIQSGVDIFYNPELDDYSGILLYDLGDHEGFVRHARYVSAKLKRNGIRKLITVDPHTTYAMKVLYPKYTGEHFDVKAYFELIDLESNNGRRRVTLHDPCFYGRYLELSDVPAKVLSKLDIECVPVRNSGLHTNCCGGPAESISPKLAREVGQRRLSELKNTGETVVAMCPICFANLKKAGADVEDFSTIISRQVA